MPGNPAFGQCYPTSRVVQHFFPAFEIAKGWVETGDGLECHFWNVLEDHGRSCHTDLTWEQFPPESSVLAFVVLDRSALNDSPDTIRRCDTLRRRVIHFLDSH